MFNALTRRILIGGLFMAVLAVTAFPLTGWLAPMTQDGALHLQPPPFISVAHAQGNSSFADSEAGISAYIRAGGTINLATVVPFFRTIETQTADYILGSVAVTDYDDSHDVKVYIHKDGWVMAYYPRSEPTSRIFDWVHYDGSGNLPTKLEEVLTRVGTQVGASNEVPSYYHFAQPNANRLLLVADNLSLYGGSGNESFDVDLPTTFNYLNHSWSFSAYAEYLSSAELLIDGTSISSIGRNTPSRITVGVLSSTQLSAGRPHSLTFSFTNSLNSTTSVSAGLALLYEVS